MDTRPMLQIDGLPLSELRTHRSEKWRMVPADVLPLPVAEMDFEIAEPIRDLLIDRIQHSDVGYLGAIPELAITLMEFTDSRWGWKIDPDQVFIATDVGVAMVEMARTVVQPGEKIVVNSPVYHNFYNWAQELKCEVLDAPLLETDLHYSLDFAAIEKSYQQGAKLHFLCNPQNPVGTVFSHEDLSQLAELAHQYNVAIFSDEVHAPLVYSDSEFVPFLAVSETARKVGICVTAASKSWNLAGLKCATIITADEFWKEKALSMPPAVHYRASLLGALAAAKAYECIEWLDAVMRTLDRNRKFLQDQLAAKLPQVRYRIPDFGYLAWLDFTDAQLGADPTSVILERAKVSLNPGHSFSPHSHQFSRLNFATSLEIIEAAVDRIAELIKTS